MAKKTAYYILWRDGWGGFSGPFSSRAEAEEKAMNSLRRWKVVSESRLPGWAKRTLEAREKMLRQDSWRGWEVLDKIWEKQLEK